MKKLPPRPDELECPWQNCHCYKMAGISHGKSLFSKICHQCGDPKSQWEIPGQNKERRVWIFVRLYFRLNWSIFFFHCRSKRRLVFNGMVSQASCLFVLFLLRECSLNFNFSIILNSYGTRKPIRFSTISI